MRIHNIASAVLLAVAATRADVVDDVSSAASVSSEVESATSSGVSRPTFTVCCFPSRSLNVTSSLTSRSPRISKRPSSSSSQMTGIRGGRHHTPRRRPTSPLKRSGSMSAPGPSRNQPYSRVWRAIKVLLSRTRLLTTPFLPNLQSQLIPRARTWSSSTRSNFKVRALRIRLEYMANVHPDGLECGGAYMKLLQNNKKLQSEEFSNASPYVIMFGPDKCGSTNKVR